MPFSFCNFVPAAGINPEDRAVDPDGLLSRSKSRIVAPSKAASLAAIPATSPQAPAPMITIFDVISKPPGSARMATMPFYFTRLGR